MSVIKSDSLSSAGITSFKSNTSKFEIKQKNQNGKFTEENFGVAMESYSRSALSIEYVSGDGDRVAINLQSVKYQRGVLNIDTKGSDSSLNELMSYVKDQITQKGEWMIKKFDEKHGEKSNDVENSESEPVLNIPEYWNAQNTSGRIVDFSISFFGSFKGTKEEFYSRVKNAIEDGFNQAKEILGKLPSQVADLTDQTYDLVMKKLDFWFEKN
ncbi:MAG TPA: DUF5610 domain-containing protein [Chitinispirillaceae bacterium]|nr:DUF5610 domain-containing protein [Chitinispirillaceae bacterium]